jgi:hypothetical protein
LIDHDTVSRFGEPLANLISEAPRLFRGAVRRLSATLVWNSKGAGVGWPTGAGNPGLATPCGSDLGSALKPTRPGLVGGLGLTQGRPLVSFWQGVARGACPHCQAATKGL